MATQLSQRDIDALLGQMAPGHDSSTATATRPTKRYDFRKPDKFSKDHLRALQVLFEAYSRLLGTDLAGMLRVQVQVRLTSVEQLPYDEYTAQLPNPTVVGIVSCAPLPDRIIMELNMPLGFAMFDRLLGGGGRSSTRPRDVTDIEASMLRLVMQRMLPTFAEAWRGILEVQPSLDDLVFSTAYIPAGVPGTVAALVLLEIVMPGIAGTVSIAIPYTVLEPVMNKLNTQKWLASSAIDETPVTVGSVSTVALQQATVPVQVVLGTTTVPFGDLLYLQAGDVIPLNTQPGDEVMVSVGSHHKFNGQPGRIGNRIAVQISSTVPEVSA